MPSRAFLWGRIEKPWPVCVALCSFANCFTDGGSNQQAGVSHLYFSWGCSPVWVTEQFVLYLGLLNFKSFQCSVVGQCQCFLQMIHCFDVISLLCVKVTTMSLFLDCVRGGLSSLFMTRQNYSNKRTLTSSASSCSIESLMAAVRCWKETHYRFIPCPFYLCGDF